MRPGPPGLLHRAAVALALDPHDPDIDGNGGDGGDGDADEIRGADDVYSPDDTLPDASSDFMVVDLGDSEGDMILTFDGSLAIDAELAIGDFDDNVIVVIESVGIAARGRLDTGAGGFGVDDAEEAAARLGTVIVGVTDASGDIAFNLASGDYVAVVTADSYEPTVEEFDLGGSETEINEVKLMTE